MGGLMKTTCALCMLLCWIGVAIGQSRLDGTSFDVSIYNFPDAAGTVRLNDTADSNCQSEADTVVGNDAATEECLVQTAEAPSVSMTFGAGPQPIGGANVTPTVVPFAGLAAENPIVAANAATGDSVPLATWSTPGDLIEFTIRTPDDSFPSAVEDDFWGFAATGIQYPNTPPDKEIGLPFDEEIGNFTNFYFWFENADGPIPNYDIFLPTGIGVGRHPVEENRDVVYILYSEGQVDEGTDTLGGGTLDFYSHGSILDASPEIGNLLTLADGVGIDGLSITGLGFGILIEPPERETDPTLAGDFDGDGALAAADIDILSVQVGQSDLAFDLNGDSVVDGDDRTVWVETLAETFFGDTDLNGSVEFADFLALSAGFGSEGGWAAGDFDGSGDVAFADFLLLSTNFGSARAVAAHSVPEPSAVALCLLGLLGSRWLRVRH